MGVWMVDWRSTGRLKIPRQEHTARVQVQVWLYQLVGVQKYSIYSTYMGPSCPVAHLLDTYAIKDMGRLARTMCLLGGGAPSLAQHSVKAVVCFAHSIKT